MTTPNTVRVVSVKFNAVGRAQTFVADDLPSDVTPRAGDAIVVHGENGSAVGTVVHGASQITERRQLASDSPQRVVRMATHDDVILRLKQQHREREAQRIAMLKVNERGLGMKLTRVEQALDGSKLVFYFTADGRVDFRELVKELAAEFKTRIEMRQIGVRDAAKMIGGYGTCGRPLCCTTFLTVRAGLHQDGQAAGPEPQPSKLSGLCGRLKCCLVYELPNASVVQWRLRQRRRLRQSVGAVLAVAEAAAVGPAGITRNPQPHLTPSLKSSLTVADSQT
jgi:cell fate regulator YaaT (PSP1 superfamily)